MKSFILCIAVIVLSACQLQVDPALFNSDTSGEENANNHSDNQSENNVQEPNDEVIAPPTQSFDQNKRVLLINFEQTTIEQLNQLTALNWLNQYPLTSTVDNNSTSLFTGTALSSHLVFDQLSPQTNFANISDLLAQQSNYSVNHYWDALAPQLNQSSYANWLFSPDADVLLTALNHSISASEDQLFVVNFSQPQNNIDALLNSIFDKIQKRSSLGEQWLIAVSHLDVVPDKNKAMNLFSNQILFCEQSCLNAKDIYPQVLSFLSHKHFSQNEGNRFLENTSTQLNLIANQIAQQVTSGVNSNHQNIIYHIDPVSAFDLGAALDRNSPIENNSQRYHGSLNWSIKWQYQYQDSNQGCALTTNSVTLDTTLTMPALNHATMSFNQSTTNAFDQYFENLLTHEIGHLEYAIKASNHVKRQLSQPENFSNDLTCAQLVNQANALVNKTIEMYSAENQHYDEITNHGATQGAQID